MYENYETTAEREEREATQLAGVDPTDSPCGCGGNLCGECMRKD